MITYSDLYEALRKEKYNDKLQKIPKNFLSQIEVYFFEKSSFLSKNNEDSIFSDELSKTKKQIENARSVVKELFMLRQKKILGLALVAARIGIDKKDAENMLDFENELLELTTSSLEKGAKDLDKIFKGEKKKDLKNQLVRFIQDTPQVLADDSTIGPFKKGEVANLPKEITAILIQGGQADMIEEN